MSFLRLLPTQDCVIVTLVLRTISVKPPHHMCCVSIQQQLMVSLYIHSTNKAHTPFYLIDRDEYKQFLFDLIH